MIALLIALTQLLRALGIDAHLFEDGSFGIFTAAGSFGACLIRAWGC